MMDLTRRETLAAVVIGAVGVGLALAILLDSWQWSLGFFGALTLLLCGVILKILGRQDAARAVALERIEQKLDNLALRVVAESQATHRELGGLIEELGSSLHRSESPKA
jgi:membrane protein implicated in regulation of membrane protease activity